MPDDHGLTSEPIRRLTPDEKRQMAEQRAMRHLHHASSRPLSIDYELVGVCGEVEFCEQFGFEVKGDRFGQGDGGDDAALWVGRLTVDVKTARQPNHLLREADKPHSDILVLARYIEEKTSAELLGWEFDAVMVRCPTGYFIKGTQRILNHFKPWYELRKMQELHDWMDALRHPDRLWRQVPF